jgi:N-acetylmuramoyl-L-alanine amidase
MKCLDSRAVAPDFQIYKFFQCVALLALLCVMGAHAASAANIQGVRVGEHPDKTRLVIELSNNLNANAFILTNPERLVVDFKGRNLSCAPIKINDNKLVEFSRQSSDEQTLRLVFNLKKASRVKAKFSLPASGRQPNRLVVDLAPSASKPKMQLAQKPAQTRYVAPEPVVKKQRYQAAPPRYSSPARKYVVVLDPGHGGKDPGAVGAGHLYEKKVVLETAHRLKKLLEDSGRYKVIMTRSDDRYIRLSERVKIARRNNADLFMSIHADSVEKKSVRGASVYTLSEKATDAQTAKLAARENKSDLIAGVDLSDEGSDVAAILIDLALRDTKNQSTFLANQLIEKFQRSNIHMLRTPLHSAGFAVLKAPDIPSVLVEIGFMSNKSEASQLNTRGHQLKIAHSLQASIDSYFSKQAHYAGQ